MDYRQLLSFEVFGQGWSQLLQLALAFVLSSLIGLKREIKLKAAGLRTHALVGLGAALMMLVSKYGFFDVLKFDHIGLDPSRIAAQIVSGIGFIGAGLIFVRKDIIHGLTTAATIWLTAGIGMACSGDLVILALAATVGYFIVTLGYAHFLHAVSGKTKRIRIQYRPSPDISGKILAAVKDQGMKLRGFSVKTDPARPDSASMIILVQSTREMTEFADKIAGLPEVASVNIYSPKEGE